MQQQIYVSESARNIRFLGRQALKDNWYTAIIAVVIFTACVQIPGMIIDHIFGGSVEFIQQILATINAEAFLGDAKAVASIPMDLKSPLAGIYELIVQGPLTLGLSIYFINLVRRQGAQLGDIFSGFENFIKALAVSVLIGLIQLLFLLPFFTILIIGVLQLNVFMLILAFFSLILLIVPVLWYSQSFLLLADSPSLGIVNTLRTSRTMMKGNVAGLFVLYISFIGWFLLAFIVASITYWIFQLFASGLLLGLLNFLSEIPIMIVTTYLLASRVQFYDLLTGKLRLSNPGNGGN